MGTDVQGVAHGQAACLYFGLGVESCDRTTGVIEDVTAAARIAQIVLSWLSSRA